MFLLYPQTRSLRSRLQTYRLHAVIYTEYVYVIVSCSCSIILVHRWVGRRCPCFFVGRLGLSDELRVDSPPVYCRFPAYFMNISKRDSGMIGPTAYINSITSAAYVRKNVDENVPAQPLGRKNGLMWRQQQHDVYILERTMRKVWPMEAKDKEGRMPFFRGATPVWGRSNFLSSPWTTDNGHCNSNAMCNGRVYCRR